jgi:ubiquinone/menaquinone biosynthesis C-methylase UbiE
LRAERQRFVSLIPPGDWPVLDAGCGPGRDCELLRHCGLRMVGADISPGLLKIAAQRTKAELVRCDLRALPFAGQSFRGIWSCASLVHLTYLDAGHAVREFSRILTPHGALYLSVRYGTGQEWREDTQGGRRWFQLYEKTALEGIVTSSGFSIIESAVAAGTVAGQWVNIFARKA